jgi:hypothetical protein
MATDRQPYSVQFDCPVVNHRVTITGPIISLYGNQGQLVDETRTFARCTGMDECKIFATPMISKPTGCPYHDKNCS